MLSNNVKNHPDVLLKSTPFKGESKKIIGIGASTGGIDALVSIFSVLPLRLPPIVITQHIPHGFSNSFAKRLNDISSLEVYEVNKLSLINISEPTRRS